MLIRDIGCQGVGSWGGGGGGVGTQRHGATLI